MAVDPEAFFAKWLSAINTLDWNALETMVDPEVILERPQSGELIRGFAALRKELESYPGGIPADSADVAHSTVVQEPDRWAITPGYTVVRMSNAERYTTVVKSVYPDGSRWWTITTVETRSERIHRLTSFFAPEMPAPLAESIATFAHE